jgi:hypothetical protein
MNWNYFRDNFRSIVTNYSVTPPAEKKQKPPLYISVSSFPLGGEPNWVIQLGKLQ